MCQTLCAGDATELCGGSLKISEYTFSCQRTTTTVTTTAITTATTTTTTTPTTTTLVPGPCTVIQQLGCYKDNLGHTTMAQEVTSAITDPLTSENCASACNAVGSFPAVVKLYL